MTDEELLKYLNRVSGKRVVNKMVTIERQDMHGEVCLKVRDFTSICPITKKTDRGEIEITYTPGEHPIETNELKKHLDYLKNKEILMEKVPLEILDYCIGDYRAERYWVKGTKPKELKMAIKAIFRKPKKMSVIVDFCRKWESP